MEPFIVAAVAMMGGAAALVARLRRNGRRASAAPPVARALAEPTGGPDAVRVGDVLTYLDDEYWLAGELALVREGTPVMRLFSAPERGRERWVALPRDGRSVWVLYVDPELDALGWPGIEAPAGGRTLRREEHGGAAIVPAGEVPPGWEGMGRFALFRSHDTVAAVVESAAKARLSLLGKEIPRQLVQKMG